MPQVFAMKPARLDVSLSRAWHAFLFAGVDKKTGAVLFQGRVVKL